MFTDEDKLNLFRDGFITLGNEFYELQDAIDAIFDEYDEESLKNPKTFNNKYENAVDLIDEDKRAEIRTMLEKYDLEREISGVIGVQLRLSHVQLRFVKAKTPSYMPLHRDVQVYNGKLVGPLPVPYKLIFYPKTIQSEDCLKVVPRSHRFSLNRKLLDLTFNLIFNGLKRVNFDKTKAVLFDTTILHHVPAIKNGNARARLILTFTPQNV